MYVYIYIYTRTLILLHHRIYIVAAKIDMYNIVCKDRIKLFNE